MSKNIINYILILFGAGVAIYAKASEKQNVVILIIGLAILMFGIYRLASGIPSKNDKEHDKMDSET